MKIKGIYRAYKIIYMQLAIYTHTDILDALKEGGGIKLWQGLKKTLKNEIKAPF